MKSGWMRIFLNPYGWLILILSVITAFVLGIASFWWIILIGIIGYQGVLLVEMTLGRSLGRSGLVQLQRTEQENRELRAEQARLLGAIREKQEKIEAMQSAEERPAADQESESTE